jgi:hypothetical protein
MPNALSERPLLAPGADRGGERDVQPHGQLAAQMPVIPGRLGAGREPMGSRSGSQQLFHFRSAFRHDHAGVELLQRRHALYLLHLIRQARRRLREPQADHSLHRPLRRQHLALLTPLLGRLPPLLRLDPA